MKTLKELVSSDDDGPSSGPEKEYIIPGKRVYTIRINQQGHQPVVALTSKSRAEKIAAFLDRYARDHKINKRFVVEELPIDPENEAHITRRFNDFLFGPDWKKDIPF